jgi:hypothetical protein
MELWDVEASTFSRQSSYSWWLGCLIYGLATLYIRTIPGIHT